MRRRRSHRRSKNHTVRNIVISCFVITLLFATGYSAFQTVININARGNIKKMIASKLLIKKTVTNGDGLYRDIYENNRYIYKGKNVDNYITFNGELWRIISVESDNSIKIIREKNDMNYAYDTNNIGWVNGSLNLYLNGKYYNNMQDKNLVSTNKTFNIGGGTLYDDSTLEEIIQLEKSEMWNGNVALMTISDYMKASNNECKIFKDAKIAYPKCYINNYLHDSSSNGVWTLNLLSKTSPYYVPIVWSNNGLSGYYLKYSSHQTTGILLIAKPVLYLKSNIYITGKGTELEPYEIEKTNS